MRNSLKSQSQRPAESFVSGANRPTTAKQIVQERWLRWSGLNFGFHPALGVVLRVCSSIADVATVLELQRPPLI